MATNRMAQHHQDTLLLSEIAQSSVAESLASQERVLLQERERLEKIDEAERQERIRKENERLRILKMKERIQSEQQNMVEWEKTQPEVAPPEEVDIAAFDKETGTATLADEEKTAVSVPEDKVQPLSEMMDALTEGQKVVATIGQ